MSSSRIYTKPALTIEQHIALLSSRGLIISDIGMARHYLTYIGYYRLSGYMHHFEIAPDHTFKSGTTFDEVLDLYIFDRKLHILMLDAIERIEVALRATISHVMTERHGSHWHLQPTLFEAWADHPRLLDKLEDEMGYAQPEKQEHSIQNYFKRFDEPRHPPTWMIMETVSLGTISRIYSFINLHHRKTIAKHFGLQHRVFKSVLQALSYLRNLCAHHSRLWNRSLRVKPTIPKTLAYYGPDDKLAVVIAIIDLLLDGIAPNSDWKRHVYELLDQYPAIPRADMGL